MKISTPPSPPPPVGSELFYADKGTDGRTGRNDEANRVAFRNFANAPKNEMNKVCICKPTACKCSVGNVARCNTQKAVLISYAWDAMAEVDYNIM
jgi:hypothetical protein